MSLIAAITFFFFFPIMAVKQLMNAIQLVQASKDIVQLDEMEREAAKKAS